MNRLVLAFLALLPLQAPAFEGVVTFKITNAKGFTHAITYSIKGQKTRMDMGTPRRGSLSLIQNPDAGNSIVLMEGAKEARIRPFHELAVSRQAQGALEATGRHETILGYGCDELQSAQGHTRITMMAAKGLGPYRSLQGGPLSSRSAMAAWEKELLDEGYFPLRLEENGTLSEATSVEQKSLPDSLFEAPAGYKKTK